MLLLSSTWLFYDGLQHAVHVLTLNQFEFTFEAHVVYAQYMLPCRQFASALQYDTKQAITILEALERRAAFYGVTWSASKGKYRWSRDMQELAEGNTAHNRLAR